VERGKSGEGSGVKRGLWINQKKRHTQHLRKNKKMMSLDGGERGGRGGWRRRGHGGGSRTGSGGGGRVHTDILFC